MTSPTDLSTGLGMVFRAEPKTGGKTPAPLPPPSAYTGREQVRAGAALYVLQVAAEEVAVDHAVAVLRGRG